MVAHIPVLQRTQVTQAEPAAFHRVPKHVTDTGRIWAKRWHDPRRKLFTDTVKALQDAGPGKIEVNIVIEDGEAHRKAEARRTANDLDPGHASAVNRQRIE